MSSHWQPEVIDEQQANASWPPEVKLAIEQCRAALAQGARAGAIEPIERVLTGPLTLTTQERASLVLLQARLLAACGQFVSAQEILAPFEYTLTQHTDRLNAAHIYCACAVDMATRGEFSAALNVSVRAANMASSEAKIQNQIDDLYAAIVPVLALSGTQPPAVSERLMLRVLQRLIVWFTVESNNLQVAHVIALLAEKCATTADTQALEQAIQIAEGGISQLRQDSSVSGSFDPWSWAIRCWVLLANNDTYWLQWHGHVMQARGDTEADVAHLGAVQIAALERVRLWHVRLRDCYQQSGSPLSNPARVALYKHYLLELEMEETSARSLIEIQRIAPALTTSSQFVGPNAGIGLLRALGQKAVLEKMITRVFGVNGDSRHYATLPVFVQLRQCLSPLADMYAMQRLGWTADVEAYCRPLIAQNAEARTFLATLLCQRAQAAYEAKAFVEARRTCIEALRTDPWLADARALFVKISEARVRQALAANRHNFDQALALAREDLAVLSTEQGLKHNVAGVLRTHAQERLDRLGKSKPDVAEARLIAGLKNEAWLLDPDLDVEGWTLAGIFALLNALLANLQGVTAATLKEAEAVVNHAEQIFPENEEVTRLRTYLLYRRVDWHVVREEHMEQLRASSSQREAVAQDIERAWQLDSERGEEDEPWTANKFVLLADLSVPADGWPATIEPYDIALEFLDRGLRLVPDSPELIVARAEILRVKAAAIIHFEGGFANRPLSYGVKGLVLKLFAESWQLDATSVKRALAMTRACAAIGEYVAAEYYAHSAVLLEPDNFEAQTLWVEMHARLAGGHS